MNTEQQKASQSFWNSRAHHFDQKAAERSAEREALVSRLEAGGLINSESQVLDIGCGPGTYAVPLAERTWWVTALDVSSQMLAFCKERAAMAGVKNLTLLEMDWRETNLETHQWEGAFDLVMASMSPGVHNAETLDKLMKASRKACYLSAFVRRNDSLGDALHRHLQVDSGPYDGFPAPYTNKIDYTDHVLQQQGYSFTRNHFDRRWEQSMSLEEAIDHYTKRLLMSHSLTKEQHKKIADFLQTQAVDNVVTEITDVTVGELFWTK
ncbi:class I SAM-dependent methyltransferase [Anoxynatronum buryatiense]|uniref:Methyltransferase domain-containing protein n=1 Tax=Anoxynatronum buryatiense TaxID=489973 RepID=A0AA45WT19_9CLOT|nr:class I SAM-dependent methyltransferase [Anoxynatronum buryatiense]SMP40249.1 Methyltransferase domain-containing protein [Anoxynatronum buryatiense]